MLISMRLYLKNFIRKVLDFPKNSTAALAIETQWGTDEDRLLNYRNQCSWIDLYYGNVELLIKLINAKNIIEVGVAYGYHADSLLSNLPKLNYVGIDPYPAVYDVDDHFPTYVSRLFSCGPEDAMNRLYLTVNTWLTSKYQSRFNLIREASLNAVKTIEFESVDIVFLDGDHRFEVVSEEIERYWPLVNKGGILAGDDYEWPGVKMAVENFSKAESVPIFFLSNENRGYATWFVQKNKD